MRLMIGLLLAHYMLHVFTNLMYNNYNDQFLTYKFLMTLIPQSVTVVTWLQFLTFLNLAKNRLQLINQTMYNISATFSNAQNVNEMINWNVKNSKIWANKSIEPFKPKNDKYLFRYDLMRIQYIFTQLEQFCSLISNCFAIQLIIIISIKFASLTTILYIYIYVLVK